MTRIGGRKNGEKLRPIQYANDWISADDSGGKAVIVRPTAVRLDPEDRAMFARSGDPEQERRRTGRFWDLWDLDDDGFFSRRDNGFGRPARLREPVGSPA